MVFDLDFLRPASVTFGAGMREVPFDVGAAGDVRNVIQIKDAQVKIEFRLSLSSVPIAEK